MRTHTMWIAAAIALAIVACDDSTTEAPLAPSPTVGTPAPVAGTETAPVPPNTLRHDAERYLDQKASQLISIRDRRRNLYQWMERFGHIRTLALDQHIGELNAQLYEWRKNLSGATCNHRRDALMNVVRVLYGSRAASGLSDLVTFPKAPPKPRALDRSHIADVIRKVEPESKLRARLELMQWTRMRPSQMGRLTPEDFQLDAEIPHVIVAQGKGGRQRPSRCWRKESRPPARSSPSVRSKMEDGTGEQRIGQGGPAGRAADVHDVPDPVQLRDRTAPKRRRRRRHPGPVRAHERGDDENLRAGADGEAPAGDRATPRRGWNGRPGEGRQVGEKPIPLRAAEGRRVRPAAKFPAAQAAEYHPGDGRDAPDEATSYENERQ